MQLKVGFSTCPNDTFMFDAMINKRIDTYGLSFLPELSDIEQLNRAAQIPDFDIIKISYAAYPLVTNSYQILNAGSALGYANGPLLVVRENFDARRPEDIHIAIPGLHTTANLLLSIAYPAMTRKTVKLFSDIEDAVLKGEVDAGLLIHENRFTYQERGLKKIADLGTWWEEQTGLPIPLGGIMVKRLLSQDIKNKINHVLHNSVSHGLENPADSLDYIRKHAQSMQDDVMQKHIELYVNDYSLDLGDRGRFAIKKIFERAGQYGKIKTLVNPIFAN